jgi:hypothetical protein
MYCVATIAIYAVLIASVRMLRTTLTWKDTYCSVVDEALT